MLNELILGRALYCRNRTKTEGPVVSTWKSITRNWHWIRKQGL